jgi:YVTN family beta-propeller protein
MKRMLPALVAALVLPATAAADPTTSSPIAISEDGRTVWSVNPGADTVSVIRAGTNRVISTIRVGDEPESVALDPDNRYAWVANSASSTVTAIRITDPRVTRFRARRARTFTTGAEPWNVVVSPDGERAFVANSGQDTITVLDARRPRIIGHVDIAGSRCNDPDRLRHFQPRGLAVTADSNRLYVTSFFAFTRPGGRQGDDTGRQGVVCRLNVDTESRSIRRYRVAQRITLAPQLTGFNVDSTGDATPDATSAFPNQLQSIVIRGGQAFLPNIAASPQGPQRFNTTTQAFLNVVNGVRTNRQSDAGRTKFLNLHLGARQPEANKTRLFFANPWAVAFTNQRGRGAAYVVSAGSDLLVKVNVSANGTPSFTVDADTTRYIDLNDPANPATAGANAGKLPQGIAINRRGTRAYVANFVSRNVSVVDLRGDRVIRTIRTAPPPPPGSPQEVVAVGAEVFFSSRGHFDGGKSDRLASEGWQSCASCHFEGLTDSVVWEFGAGPRKSVPLNGTFAPRDPNDQRLLNYSAIFDEIEDFELNIRNTSGPGPLAQPQACDAPAPGQPATSTLDPNHGLVIADNGDPNTAPCVINQFARPNADRQQLTVTLPGSGTRVPALTAMREWVRRAVRTPNGPLANRPNGVSADQERQGRSLFEAAGCVNCHGAAKWANSRKGFVSPPLAGDLATETNPAPQAGNPVPLQYLHPVLFDIGSFNLGVPGGGNDLAGNIGADEKATANLVNGVQTPTPPPDALGRDYNGDGRGNGYNNPSLLGILASPPYYHNGACETLRCVVDNVKHRTANGSRPDGLPQDNQRALVAAFVASIDAGTQPPGP